MRLVVENDRYGLWPLVYWTDSRSLTVSGSLAALVRARALSQLDFRALSVFFRLGHFVGDDTAFDGVHTLAPGTRLVWERGEITTESTWAGNRHAETGPICLTDAAARYATLFESAVARRVPSNSHFIVPISGGRDSRHLLLELHRQGYVPERTVTVRYRPPSNDEDVSIGRELAARVGSQHRIVNAPSSLLEATLHDIHACHHASGGHAWAAPLASELSTPPPAAVYDGLAGDVLSAGLLQDEHTHRLFISGELRQLAARWLDGTGREATLKTVPSPEWMKHMPREVAIDRLEQELGRHAAFPWPTRSFLFWNRTRRYVALIPLAILEHVPIVHLPFLDHDLFDFFMTLPDDLVAKNRLHDETIRRSYPAFADMPFERKEAPRTTLPEYTDYYRRTRAETASYLSRRGPEAATAVRARSLKARLMWERLTGRADPPWTLNTMVQAIELERLRVGAGL